MSILATKRKKKRPARISQLRAGKTLTVEELDQLEQYGEWLRRKTGGLFGDEPGVDDLSETR